MHFSGVLPAGRGRLRHLPGVPWAQPAAGGGCPSDSHRHRPAGRREAVTPESAHRIELLPGPHSLEWTYRYPNGYGQEQSLVFKASAGQQYRLGQRFFARPHPGGPVGAIVDLALSVAVSPITVFLPQETPDEPPEGEYYSWVLERATGQTVAGRAPDVPLDHAPVTYVPLDQGKP